jgi:hypothetical protein
MDYSAKEVETIRLKDKLFRNFCQTVKQIPDFHKNDAKNLAI